MPLGVPRGLVTFLTLEGGGVHLLLGVVGLLEIGGGGEIKRVSQNLQNLEVKPTWKRCLIFSSQTWRVYAQ